MNTTPRISLKSVAPRAILSAGFLFFAAAMLPAQAANQIWTGGGADNFWETAANWSGGGGISPGDSLLFGGTIRNTTTNNFPTGTAFDNITFAEPAGPFTLNGNSISLNGNITNNQVVTTEAVTLPLALAVTPTVDVVPNGVLTISGVISGANGLTKTDGGQINLTAANLFTGPLSILGGTVAAGADPNLGAVPASATVGDIVINGGILRATNSFTINANRGIAVGSASGGGGTVIVDAGKTLTYSGIIANNGGSGGLSKSSFGGLTLSGANTYTGPTVIQNGLLTLNFGAAGAPANNIISGSSPLTVGGTTAGVGQTNYAGLLLSGAASTAVSQTFNGTVIAPGGEFIQATNGTSGSATLALGPLTHNVGGTVVLLPPASGNITTISANNNGILGGWATIGSGANQNGVLMGTNFATVGPNGVITNYNGYFNYSSGLLAGQVGPGTNVLFGPTASPQVVSVNTDNSGLTTDLNSMKFLSPWTNSSIYIGPGNTLRLGQYGGILAQEGATIPTLFFGGINNTLQSGSGTTNSQDIGTLTAGGAPNTPGEIVLTINNNNETSGSFVFESKITDNGSGQVAFVKAGPGPMKLDGHNTFSGGLYILQGRLQFAGQEIGSGNPGGGGTGPIYVYPGAELFPSGALTIPITNSIFISGNGVSDGVGAIRLSGVFSNGVINLIGDSRLGGGGTNTAAVPIYDKITGPFNLDFGATGNSGSTGNGAIVYNQSNDWSGNTTIVGRTGTAGNTLLINGASDVIPDGFGKGNVIFGNSGNSVSVTAWDLRGFNETINGLISAGTVPSLMYITNTTGTLSTLTIGNNDQSGTFSGAIRGDVALTKIGAGIETLTGSNTFTGVATVNAGTLAMSGAGSIYGGNILINAGGTMNVTAANGEFSNAIPLAVNGGTLTGNAIVGALAMTNGMLTLDLNTAATNIIAGSLTTGGTTNFININSVSGVTGYPAQFTLVKYSGSLGGVGNNIGIGAVPNAVTTGYISNDVVNSRIVLVLLNGPKSLTWAGTDPVNPTYWDLNTTTNWISFKGSPSQAPAPFNNADSLQFDDTGSSATVDLISVLAPSSVTINNSLLNYTFDGLGALTGTTGLSKSGSGSVTFLETGGDSYKGAISANAGTMIFGADNGISSAITIASGATVQVGLNNGAGTLPGGNVVNSGSVIFDRGADLTVPNVISGTGSLSKLDANVLTLSGANTFTGAVTVAAGTLRAGNGTAFGTADGNTVINSGATLDVDGQTLQTEPVVVSGTGVGGNGAIVNSGADDLTALGNVTLGGNTTVGGNGGRWDIRGGSAILSTSGNAYSLTKSGTNYVAIVGIAVDGSLGDINILSGLLSIETTTSSLGDPSHTLTVDAGATLQFYGTTANFSKQLVLNGDGVTTTLNCGNGAANLFSGPITLNGACIFNSGTGDALLLAGSISGNGSLLKTGPGTNILSGSATFIGGTTISNGTLVVDGSLSGAVAVDPGATLAGGGTASGTVTVSSGGVSPGDPATSIIGTLNIGTLSLNNATLAFDLSPTPISGNDLVNVTGGLTLSGNNVLQISPTTFMNVGDQYTLIQYTGTPLPSSVTNNLAVISARTGFSFSIVDPGTTPNAIKIQVMSALGNDFWTGAASSTWDTSSINWLRNNNPVAFNSGDFANFNDTSSVTNVTLAGAEAAGGITVSANSEVYNFIGGGKLTGTGGLHVAGIGLVIDNSGTNDFTGPMLIDSGALILGNGGTNGNVGSGAITNNGSIIFNRTDNGLDLNNAITGSGSLSLVTNGSVTLGGASTFQGAVNVLMGTVRAASSGALGGNVGVVNVNPGATLDVTNSANLSAKQIYVSGTGVNGNGAIINDSGNVTFIGQNIVNVTLNNDTTFGGSGRLDFRASTATAADAILFGGFNLTKVGTNLLQFAGVQIDPSLGAINVAAGTFGIQWSMPGLGDPSQNLSISNGATFAIYDLSNAVTKVLILNDGSTVANQHGTNTFSGPVTLIGTNIFNISDSALILNSTLSGTGNLRKTGADQLVLSSAAETYTGNTYVNQGRLVLSDVATISSSPAIILVSNSTIDVTSRNDGTLTLGSAGSQTLAGGGSVSGNLVENSGSVVNPGDGVAPAQLSVNSATLNGTVIMDLNRTAGTVTNDEIICPSITVSGALLVTNLGPDLITSNRFQLFSIPVSGFSSVQLPVKNVAGNVTYSWQNNLSTDGSILLLQGASPVNTNPTNITFAVSGGNLNLSWPVDHTGWRLQAQTNTVAIGLNTNWSTVAGSTTVNQISVPINSANGTVFYRLVYP
ncbi:MAG TPA: autotransporter-associated beta strand repeat-containing protein [Verrucomicrobiae bacterium]|jgi:autotransporter-associated beta strand protein